MNWKKLRKINFFTEPVEHIYSPQILDSKEFDALYENINDLSHKSWLDFDEKYKTPFQVYDNLHHINKNKEIICLLFFKDRSDKSSGYNILLGGKKKIKYFYNGFFMTPSKNIKIIDEKRAYIHNYFLQLDIKKETYTEVIKNLQ